MKLSEVSKVGLPKVSGTDPFGLWPNGLDPKMDVEFRQDGKTMFLRRPKLTARGVPTTEGAEHLGDVKSRYSRGDRRTIKREAFTPKGRYRKGKTYQRHDNVRYVFKAASAETKRKEQQFGLANNAFGAAAGAYGTKAVYDQTREKHYAPQAAAAKLRRQQKASDRAAGRYAAGKNPFTPLQRVRSKVGAVTSKVPKKYAAPAALGAAVGSQVINAGADAQSAAYFARELATTPKPNVKKAATIQSQMEIAPGRRGGGYGRRIVEEPVAKAVRRFDSEADRQHRLGIYEGLGATGAIGGVAGGGVLLNRQGVKMGNIKRKLGKHKLPLALVGAAGASGATSVAARRAYLRDRNEAWS